MPLLVLLVALAGCSDVPTRPTVCEGLRVHYRVAMGAPGPRRGYV